MNETFLCIGYTKNSISQAFYSYNKKIVELSQVWTSSVCLSTIERLQRDFNPSGVLISESLSVDLKTLFSCFNLIFIKKSDFSFEESKEILVETCFKKDEFSAITSLDFSNQDLIGTCGALVKFLKNSNLGIKQIRYFNPSYLNVDLNTLTSLQIIQEDSHPSDLKNIGNSKDGISILSLIDNTSTPQGKRKLRDVIMNPLKKIEEIDERLEIISFFLQRFSTTCELSKLLKFSGDLEKIIKRMKEGQNLSSDWKKLLTTVKVFIEISKKLTYFPGFPLIILRISEVNLEVLMKVLNLLENCINLSGTKPSIHRGVSEELDYFQTIFEEVEEIKTQIIKSEKSKLSSIRFSKISIIYIQGIGNLLELFFEDGKFPEDLDGDYSFQFATDNCLYFKSSKTVALDEKFGDINSKSTDLENSLLVQVESEILKYSGTLSEVSSILADLDVFFSLALFAENFKLTRPVLSSEFQVQVVNGRHLLVEFNSDSCIPNDCALDQVHRIGLITGPNYSGKSVYIKMIGIIVYLTHIGSYVPAEQAEIGRLEHIFSRVDSGDSRISSCFTNQLKQVSIALHNSCETSLLIFDEFGKGTSATDGFSFFTSLIEEVEQNPNASGLFSTHFHEIFSKGLVNENNCVRFYSMEVSHLEQMVFLYKLLRGASLNSFGIFCAGLAGVSQEIIERSEQLQKSLQDFQEMEKRKKKILENLYFVKNCQDDLNENESFFQCFFSLIGTLN